VPDVRLLSALGATNEHHDNGVATLREVQPPAGADVDAQFRHAITHRLDVPNQAELEPLDASDDDAVHARVSQAVQPRREFRERLDCEYVKNVIDRLHVHKGLTATRRIERRLSDSRCLNADCSSFAVGVRKRESRKVLSD